MSIRQRSFLSIFFTYPDSFSGVAILVTLLSLPLSRSLSLLLSLKHKYTLSTLTDPAVFSLSLHLHLCFSSTANYLDVHPQEFDICINHAFSCSLFLML